MTRRRTYSDERLAEVIAHSRSWRGVLRELGLTATSAAAIRSVRSHADRLGVDYSHFRGRRRWCDDDLRAAVLAAGTWSEVAGFLGVDDGASVSVLKGHAARLGLDHQHLAAPPTAVSGGFQPHIAHLRGAGSLLAASWFTLCGLGVSWPLEPSRYDLLVCTGDGIRRVQVKTTTTRVGRTWKVYLSTSRGGRKTYDLDEIDDFFVIDGALTSYLIPVAAVGGLHAIHLSGYEQYRLAQVTSDLDV